MFYTAVPSDTAQPQSALRDNLSGVTRLTKIDLPKIDGSTITWTVPTSAFPKELTLPATLSNLFFEVREIQDFRGQKIPDSVPTVGGIPADFSNKSFVSLPTFNFVSPSVKTTR